MIRQLPLAGLKFLLGIVCRKDLKYPPTAVGGIRNVVLDRGYRKDLKSPLTAVSGIICTKPSQFAM